MLSGQMYLINNNWFGTYYLLSLVMMWEKKQRRFINGYQLLTLFELCSKKDLANLF